VICPDIERVIAGGMGESDAPELEVRVKACADCRAYLRIVDALAEGIRKGLLRN